MRSWRVFKAAAALEAAQLRRNRAFVILTALAAVSFLAMVSLFGLTGAYAPVALINLDDGPYATRFIDALNKAHHSFALKYMSAEQARIALNSGRLVGVLTVPAGFSDSIKNGNTVPIDISVDNVNLDLTNDVQRALPAAIVRFGHDNNFPGVRVIMAEHPVNKHDTGYIPYLVVSALALDAMPLCERRRGKEPSLSTSMSSHTRGRAVTMTRRCSSRMRMEARIITGEATACT